MRVITFLLLLLVQYPASAQNTRYVAAGSGLSLKNGNTGKGTAITNIPYGEQLSIDTTDINRGAEVVTIDGMAGTWIPVIYKGQKGYAFEAYLAPVPPPVKGTKNMMEYAGQLSPMACGPVVNTDTTEYHEYPAPGRTVIEDTRILYKNGYIYTKHTGWLTNSESLIMQGITMQQAFVIAQHIATLKELIPNDEFPKENHSEKTEEGERGIIVKYSREPDEDGQLEKVIFYEWGVEEYMNVSIHMLNQSQVVITLEWGL